MPSFPFTPAAIVVSGASISPIPIRFTYTPGAVSAAGGSFDLSTNFTVDITDLDAVLDNLFASEGIVDGEGRPSRRFQQIWQNAVGGLKDVIEAQGLAITGLQDAYDAIAATQAQTAAVAQDQAVLSAEVDLASSYTVPINVLTADSSGTITIAAHSRVYSGNTVAVNGGSVSGFGEGQFVRVYYMDAARTGGTVAYQGTTAAVVQGGDTHVVGGVAIPMAGDPPETGEGPRPPGYVEDYR